MPAIRPHWLQSAALSNGRASNSPTAISLACDSKSRGRPREPVPDYGKAMTFEDCSKLRDEIAARVAAIIKKRQEEWTVDSLAIKELRSYCRKIYPRFAGRYRTVASKVAEMADAAEEGARRRRCLSAHRSCRRDRQRAPAIRERSRVMAWVILPGALPIPSIRVTPRQLLEARLPRGLSRSVQEIVDVRPRRRGPSSGRLNLAEARWRIGRRRAPLAPRSRASCIANRQQKAALRPRRAPLAFRQQEPRDPEPSRFALQSRRSPFARPRENRQSRSLFGSFFWPRAPGLRALSAERFEIRSPHGGAPILVWRPDSLRGRGGRARLSGRALPF